MRARRHKALPERLPLLQGIKELPSTRPTCQLQHASWPPFKTSLDFPPPRPSSSLRTRARAARAPLPRNWPIRGRDCTAGHPPPLPGSGLHVSVFGYVRQPRGWENKPWGAPGLGNGGEEPPCQSRRALNSTTLGQSVQSYLPVCS